jgi:hypothetical protein
MKNANRRSSEQRISLSKLKTTVNGSGRFQKSKNSDVWYQGADEKLEVTIEDSFPTDESVD